MKDDSIRQKEVEYLNELKKAKANHLAWLAEIEKKIAALTGKSAQSGYQMSPLGKEIIILAANIRGLKQRVGQGHAPKSELAAAEKQLRELKAKAITERKQARNKRVRDLRAQRRTS